MTDSKWLFAVIAIVLFSPLRHPLSTIDESVANSFSEEISESQEQPWSRLQNPVHAPYQFSESSGLIHSTFGSFDPISDQIYSGPWLEFGIDEPYDNRLHIVQSTNSDLQSLEESLSYLGLEIIDHIPDDSVVISLPDRSPEEFTKQVQSLPQVRWIGPLPAMWKISPSLLPMLSLEHHPIDLDISLSPSNSEEEVEGILSYLAGLDDNLRGQYRCDNHLCQVKSAHSSLITDLSIDYRIIMIQPGQALSVDNSNASLVAGAQFARTISSHNLTGYGEVIGISDTGLDYDHGDFQGRLRSPIFNLFGADTSGADANSGHGTHVTATLLGDGSGDQAAMGMVPEATFNFYQLEVDSSGVLARWGSLYDMFEHSRINDAFIHTNSWGSETLVGDYTSDSRSADWFTNDFPEFLVVFSSGDLSESGVTSPATAKNVLSVGTSTTGAFTSAPIGSVSNDSSSGPTTDGRIKPDLVAPGVMICSARAEEASLASGGPCSNSVHDDGSTPKYMTLSGSSMATPVVAGAAAMARQFLRDDVGISSPRSDLIRALLVNGADDLGNSDVPNNREGWGQLNISNSLFPVRNGVNQTVFYDQGRQLMPGHSFTYTFDVSGNSGIEASLAWNDKQGSASADQNESRLVNDLDLIVTSPDGTVFKGNNFANGVSQSGGERDQKNNLERIRVTDSQIGIWTIQIGHSGGFSQQFSLVLSAEAEEVLGADLSVVPESIYCSETSPLIGDTISLQLSWINQAPSPSGDYSILVEDITEGSVIGTYPMQSLLGGSVESFSIYHSFQSTGPHLVRMTLDHLSEVSELNDETSGTDNNIFDLLFNVTEIGVRITPLLEDGSHPITFEDSESAKHRNIDPSMSISASFQLELQNQGTSQITVDLIHTPVQEVDESGILDSPQDEWSRNLNQSSPWTLSPFGEIGDRVLITLQLTDEDADLDARFALPGLFVTDLTLFDISAPTVSHSVRLSVDVERVEGLFTVPAGTEGLGAKPDEFALFTISVKNIGNGPTEYSISCETTNRWIVRVGSGDSSESTIGPLSRLQFVPVQIRVRVPPSSSGLPAGFTDLVSCITRSVNDPSLEMADTAVVEVLESRDFSTQIADSEGNKIGPLAISESRAVLNGNEVSTFLTLTNQGNVPLEFGIQALSSMNTWPIQIFLSDQEPPSGEVYNLQAIVQPGNPEIITIRTKVPLAAEKGDRNTISVKTTLDGNTVTNGTVLEVREITTLEISSDSGFEMALGRSANSNIFLHNSGNVPLLIELTMGTLPEGWSGGFLSGNTFSMDMNRDSIISIGLEIPSGVPAGELTQRVPVIIESTSPSLSKEVTTVELNVTVVPSVWIVANPSVQNLEGITESSGISFSLEVTNSGNTGSGVEIEGTGLVGWNIEIEPSFIEFIGAGESAQVSITLAPGPSSEDGLRQFTISAKSTSQEEGVELTNSSVSIEVSRSKESNGGGILGILESLGLPAWSLAALFLVAIGGIASLVIRARRDFSPIGTDEELIPKGSALQAGNKEERRAAALDTSTSGEVVTGEVSDSEIEETLQSTLPKLPSLDVPEGALPLPLTGLPEGWTMDQWVAYGHVWWEQNGPKSG